MNNQNEGMKKAKKIPFEAGMIVFCVILLYFAVFFIKSLSDKKIYGYQVKYGSLSENCIYKGIALRDEKVVYSDYSGYLNYFINEGERAGYNNLVYGIDESGKFSAIYGKNPTENTSLASEDLQTLKQEMTLFSKNFSEEYFPEAISFENRINSNLSILENRKIIDDITTLTGSGTKDIIDYVRAKEAGTVLYYLDGFEEALPEDLDEDSFDISKYESKINVNDDLISAGSFAYKYVFDENWSIIIKVPNEEADKILAFKDMYIEVKFSKTLNTSWALVSLVKSDDKNTFIKLSFTNSMVTFCKDRFVEVELLLERDSGLKIPNTAIVEKPFYLIDKDYVTQGSNSSAYSVLKKIYNDVNEPPQDIQVEVYKEDDDYYYIDTSSLNYGDVLYSTQSAVTTDNSNIFIVGKIGTLIGAYNINKGYAEFKMVNILYENDEYTIIDKNTRYGLRIYDYIALDGSLVTEKDFVY